METSVGYYGEQPLRIVIPRPTATSRWGELFRTGPETMQTNTGEADSGLPPVRPKDVPPGQVHRRAMSTTDTYVTASAWTDLAETCIRLDRLQNQNDELTQRLTEQRSDELGMEALAMLDDCAINLLGMIADSEGLPIKELGDILSGSNQWLSVVRLAQARLAYCLGSYLYLTTEGQNVARIIFDDLGE